LIFFLLATVASTVAYFGFAFGHVGDAPGWPGGSSLPGLIFGVLGGAIILFEFLLWFRKKVRVWRIGRAQTWLRAHIWLGLLCVPLLIYHSGFRLGGSLSTVLMILLLIVILSGIWGLFLQQILPTRMLEQIPAETIFSQIDRLSEQLSTEARQLVQATCGLDPDDKTEVPGSSRGDAGERILEHRRLARLRVEDPRGSEEHVRRGLSTQVLPLSDDPVDPRLEQVGDAGRL